MMRCIGIIVAGLVTAGISYGVSGGGVGTWISERGADFVRAAARGTEPREFEADRGAAMQALAARPEQVARTGVGGGVRMLEAKGPVTAILPSERGATLPRPVAPRMAQATAEASDGDAPSGAAETGSRRLAKAIQTELRRVGCYQGRIDGDWDAGTRQAMKAFNERVNASLPVRQPDYILLTLVQSHIAKACGAACPAGQAATEGGSCQPLSVLADKRRPPRSTHDSETTRWAAIASGAATAIGAVDRGRLTDSRGGSAADARNVASAAPAGPSRAEVRTRDERDLIAAAEARKRQHAAELRVRADAERAVRIAEVERAWTAAEARRRDELAALAQRQSAAVEQRAPSRPAAMPGRDVALAEIPPASERIGAHILTRPADARFVGRFLPPPTYRVGRLPPSPAPRLHAPSVRINGYAAPRRPSGLRTIFKSVERNSP